MKIGNIDLDHQVFIIAEIGNNHEGNFDLAQEMVGLAAKAGADAVKFQTIVPELLVSCDDQNRIDQLKQFQFSYEQFAELANQATAAGIVFLSTPFDLESARFLNTIQPVFKIASGDNTFFPLIDVVARFEKPMMISTGLADLKLVQTIHDRVYDIWSKNNTDPGLALLHCVSSYPTPDEQANLGVIQTLKQQFPLATVGYSDHTLGIDAAMYSVAAGARIVEKHFTLDKNHSNFRDHQLSADPDELQRMVTGIRKASKMLGTGEKQINPCEADIEPNIRRSIACAMDIPAGTVLSDDHFIWVRPGTGISPGTEAHLCGKKTIRAYKKGELINLKDFQ